MPTRDQAVAIYFRLNLCQRVPLWPGVYAKLAKITISDSKKLKPLRNRKQVALFHTGMAVLKLPILKIRFQKISVRVFKWLFFSPWYLSIFLRYPPPFALYPYFSPICVSAHSAKIIKCPYLHSEANICSRKYMATHIIMLSGLQHDTAKRSKKMIKLQAVLLPTCHLIRISFKFEHEGIVLSFFPLTMISYTEGCWCSYNLLKCNDPSEELVQS